MKFPDLHAKSWPPGRLVAAHGNCKAIGKKKQTKENARSGAQDRENSLLISRRKPLPYYILSQFRPIFPFVIPSMLDFLSSQTRFSSCRP